VEVYFKGETVLDNGLTVGARIELEGQQSGDQIDEVWAYFKGGWGQIRFGDDDDAYEQLSYLIPSASKIFGVDTPNFEFANNLVGGNVAQTNSTVHRLSGDATKVIYFTPNFGGFTFAASWAPDRRGEDTYSGFTGATGGFGGGGTTGNNNAGQVDDVFAGALNFTHDFNGVNLVLGIGGGHANYEAPVAGQDDDLWVGRAHVVLGFAGFTIGSAASYESNWRADSSEPNRWVVGVGGTYNWDAWTVGLAWSHGEYDVTSNSDTDTLDIVEATARYDLGPGISLEGMLGYNAYNNDNLSTSDNRTVEAGVGFYIGF
jgi:hypothetical protein